jgi:hypothetical protein
MYDIHHHFKFLRPSIEDARSRTLESAWQLLLICPYATHAGTRYCHTVQSAEQDLVDITPRIRDDRIAVPLQHVNLGLDS